MSGGGKKIPPGFEPVKAGRLRAVVRSDVAAALEPLLTQWARGELGSGRVLAGGRGSVQAYDVAPGLSIVIRPYLRGGLVRHFSREHYFGARPRPYRELRVTEMLRHSGVPTVEVLAAGVRWVVPGIYRGVLMTREVPGAMNLWQYWRAVEPADRERIAAIAAAATIALHGAGGVHPDLNLQNYLVSRAAGGYAVRVIDCDGVRLRKVTPRDRQAAFDRLCRSVRRLDPNSEVVTLGCLEALQAIVAAPAAN